MAENLQQWLKKQQENWDSAAQEAKNNPTGGGFATYAQGKYVFRLGDAELGIAESGRKQIHWQHVAMEEISDGKNTTKKGTIVHHYEGIENEKSFLFLAQKLAKFGYDPTEVKLVNLPKILKELSEKKPIYRGQVKYKDDFLNVYVNKILEDYDEESGSQTFSSEEEVEFNVGMKVNTENNGAGTIQALDPVNEMITVKLDTGDIVTISAGEVTPA